MGEARQRKLRARFSVEHGPLPEWTKPFFEHISVIEWQEHRADDSARCFVHVLSFLSVIVSGSVEEDGRRWLHVSFARPYRLPSWEDLQMVKETFIGKNKRAVQILPEESKYVNVNPYCLHLWHCLDDDGLPDFTVGRPVGHL